MENRGNVGAITTRHGSKCGHRDLSSFLWVDLTRDTSILFEAIRDHVAGYKISSRAEVWPAIKRWDPVFVCFEYECPEPAELQVLRETRVRHPGLPILMLTAYHSEELAVWAFRTGVWDYLVKPIAREVLSETVQALLACSRSGPAVRPTPPSEDGSPPPRPGTAVNQRRRLAERTAAASAYIAKNYPAKITAAAAAEQCHLSCSQFSRTFKKEHGACFQQYLIRYRINQACKILASFEVPVKEAAFSVGFTDLCHFARTFRQHVGMLPSAFKARDRSQYGLALPVSDAIAE